MDVIDKFFTIASSIYTLCEKVNTNKKECQDLAKRVEGWEPLIHKIKERGAGNISEDVFEVLRDLTRILEAAEKVVNKYSTDGEGWKRLVKVNKHGEEFEDLNRQLDEVFQRLSTAQQLETQDKIDGLKGNVPSGQNSLKGMTKEDKVNLVNQHMAVLIQEVKQVKPIVDALKKRIHGETYAEINVPGITTMDQMRILYTKVLQTGGRKVQLEFYELLEVNEFTLLEKIVEGDLPLLT